MSEQKHPSSDIGALVVIEKHSEAMDVSILSDTLTKFGVQVWIASAEKHKPVQLTGDVKILPHLTLDQASHHLWHMLILPGGNRAVKSLMENNLFGELLEQHDGLVAALGAFAVALADPLGPTCYPLKDSPVVVKETDNLWTCPGLGTSTELALALGQQFCGIHAALEVAKEIDYRRNHWDVSSLQPVEQTYIPRPKKRARQSPSNKENDWFRQQKINTAYYEIVWPVLNDKGWKSNYEQGWIFMKPNCKDQESGQQGVDWFASANEVLRYLDAIPKWKQLMTKFKARQRVGLPKRNRKISTCDPLFDHVVWPRLELLGWNYSRRKRGIVFQSPSGVEVEHPDRVLLLLAKDPAWRLNPKTLCIMDLYQNCQRVQRTLSGPVDPERVEEETKRLMPALTMY